MDTNPEAEALADKFYRKAQWAVNRVLSKKHRGSREDLVSELVLYQLEKDALGEEVCYSRLQGQVLDVIRKWTGWTSSRRGIYVGSYEEALEALEHPDNRTGDNFLTVRALSAKVCDEQTEERIIARLDLERAIIQGARKTERVMCREFGIPVSKRITPPAARQKLPWSHIPSSQWRARRKLRQEILANGTPGELLPILVRLKKWLEDNPDKHRWRHIDIAQELGVRRETITRNLKKLGHVTSTKGGAARD